MDSRAAREYGRDPAARLAQALRPRHVAMIAVGGMIGAGLFVGSSVAIATTGPAIAVSYVAAGVIILLVMRMLSEMLVAKPATRLFTDCIREGLGDWAGFVSGWLYWFSWMVVVAIEAIAAATLVQRWVSAPAWLTGLGLMALMSATNLFSARAFGEVEFWLSSIKVGAVAVFVVIGAAYAVGVAPLQGSGNALENLLGHGGIAPFGSVAVVTGVVTVIFSLMGAEIATVAAAESPDPARAVGRLTGSLVTRVLLCYVGSVVVIMSVVPWTVIQPGKSPFVSALLAMHIPAADIIMSCIVLTAVLSCLNSGLFVTSRILFGLAAKGDAPPAMIALSSRKVPARSILLGGLCGYLGVLASVISPTVVFVYLVNSVGALMLLIYLMLVLAQIRLRYRLQADAPDSLQLKMWLFPGLSCLTGLAIVAVLVGMAFTPARAAELYTSLISVAVACVAYIPVHLRRRAQPGSGHV